MLTSSRAARFKRNVRAAECMQIKISFLILFLFSLSGKAVLQNEFFNCSAINVSGEVFKFEITMKIASEETSLFELFIAHCQRDAFFQLNV